MDCIFCKIAKGEIDSETLYEDEFVKVFRDLNPEAPFHALLIPKKHISSVNEMNEEDESIIGRIFSVAKKIAEEAGFDEEGYRIVNNNGPKAGQTVNHMHFHLLAGRDFKRPPG